MLYQLHEFNRNLLHPLVAWSQASAKMFSSPDSWLSRLPEAHRVAANYELLYRLGKGYEKPRFRIQNRHPHGRRDPLLGKNPTSPPLCNRVRFTSSAPRAA